MGGLSLLGKTAVVTGASGSIGRAIAVQFAREGAQVVLAGRAAPRLEDTLAKVKALRAEDNGALKPQQPHSTFAFDVRALQGWQSLVAEHSVRQDLFS
jgi:3-oxoacyl-[acyl-carrier protein] reductase